MYRSVKRNLMTFLFAALMFLFGIMSQVQPVDAAAQNTTTIRLSATQTTMRIGDEKYLTAGDDFYVTELDTACGALKVGAMICYDLSLIHI